MTSAESSFLGFARQTNGKGTAVTTDANFKYLLFRQGQASSQSIVVPLDQEVGGGAMLRSVAKMGVSAMGALDFVPRPNTLGDMLYGATGFVSSKRNLVTILPAHDADGSTHTTPWSNQPTTSTKVLIAGYLGAVGNVDINAVPETVALTGNNHTESRQDFKTITKIELPPKPTGSTTSTIALYETDGATQLLAAQTLATTRTTVTTGFTNPSPTDTIKVRFVTDQETYGVTVKVYGTDASDKAISEEIYCFPFELVESVSSYSAISQIVLPSSAGDKVAVFYHDGSYTHEFTLSQFDNFDAPYYTARFAPGGLWGEQFVDTRFNTLGLEFRAAQFLSGALGFTGITPSGVDSTSAWNALNYVDGGPQFLAPLGDIELPGGTDLCVLQGTMAGAMSIPMDEQFCIGSYYANGLDIVSRNFVLNLVVKVTSDQLYKRIQYDPAWTSGAANWLADIFRNSDFKLQFKSDQDAASNPPSGTSGDYRAYQLNVNGNLLSGDNANVNWNVAPINLRAQRQVLMNLTGSFLASPVNTADPIKFTLINRQAYY